MGNFRSLFVNIHNSKDKGRQIIPVGNFKSKDEFMNVKNVSTQDVLNAHRFPAGLSGIIPADTASLSNPEKYDGVYFKNETRPLLNMLVSAVDQDPKSGWRLKLVFDLE